LLGMLRQNVTRTVASLPEHAAYVARYCGVQQAQPAATAQG
jgi:tryptophan halogenase